MPRDTLYTEPSPYMRKREVSPHEIFLHNNENYSTDIVSEIAHDRKESADSDFGANNFEDYQMELDINIGTSPPRFA